MTQKNNGDGSGDKRSFNHLEIKICDPNLYPPPTHPILCTLFQWIVNRLAAHILLVTLLGLIDVLIPFINLAKGLQWAHSLVQQPPSERPTTGASLWGRGEDSGGPLPVGDLSGWLSDKSHSMDMLFYLMSSLLVLRPPSSGTTSTTSTSSRSLAGSSSRNRWM